MALNKMAENTDDFNLIAGEQDPFSLLLKETIQKMNVGFDKTNEHITKMATNDAKVGITTAQAKAIVDNTAKTGITSSQATQIETNAKKVSVTDVLKGIDDISFSLDKKTNELIIGIVIGKTNLSGRLGVK
tara:strand:- start:647 stop:1039 length:393 start_codon:yes stop_codon:yes gene_type:complete